jgi:flagellar M-ring protein FliF
MAEAVLIPADVKRTLFVRQIAFLIAIAASVAIGVYVVLWSQEPNYSLLYGSLSDQDASQVIESLQKSNIEYHVDTNTGAVMVASSKVHEARMKLATEGLPKSANSGFSILNEEQKLGTSQFMEKARYQHALENELAMSISQLKAVKAARIHLALPKESVFLRNRKAASASVLLDLYPGHRLEVGQVAAIANLVSSSVPSLELSNISIVDQNGHLMSQNQSSAELAMTSSQFQYATQVENSYIKRIENILIPLLGPDGVKAQVTAEMDFTSVEQTRESYNPDMPALRSEQLEEDSSTSSTSTGGVPGALSNQPAVDGTAPEIANKGKSGSENSSGAGSKQKRSTRNFELDKTISHTRLASGSLQRLSVAVVIDYKKTLNDAGNIIRVEHTPEELEQITNLVKETIGFNVIRGDSVNVMNSQFSLPDAVEPLPEIPIWQQPWVWDIAKQVLGGLFVLFLVFGILRPAIKNMMNKEITLHQTAIAGPGGGSADGLNDNDKLSADAKEMKALEAAPEYDKSIHNVKEMVNADPKLAAQVVRNWVGEE